MTFPVGSNFKFKLILKPDFNARVFSDAQTVLELLEEQCRNNEVYLGILKAKFLQNLGHWRLYPASDCYIVISLNL